jgi:large subunit ribosomal protein L28
VRTRLSNRVFKTMIREGGLDNYVLKTKPARIKELGPGGWRLRWLIMQTPSVRERMQAEWESLGVEGEMPTPPEGIVKVAMDFATPGPLSASTREILVERAREFAAMEEFTLGEDAEGLEGEFDGAELEEALLADESMSSRMSETQDPSRASQNSTSQADR